MAKKETRLVYEDYYEGMRVKFQESSAAPDSTKFMYGEMHCENGGWFILNNDVQGNHCRSFKGWRKSWQVGWDDSSRVDGGMRVYMDIPVGANERLTV